MHSRPSARLSFVISLVVFLGIISFVFAAAIIPKPGSSLLTRSPNPDHSLERRGYPHFWVDLEFRGKERPKNDEQAKKKKRAAITAVQVFLNIAAPELGYSAITIQRPQVKGFPILDKQMNVDFSITLLPMASKGETSRSLHQPVAVFKGVVTLFNHHGAPKSAVNGYLSRSGEIIVKVVNGQVQEGIPAQTPNKKGRHVHFTDHPQHVTFGHKDAPKTLFSSEAPETDSGRDWTEGLKGCYSRLRDFCHMPRITAHMKNSRHPEKLENGK